MKKVIRLNESDLHRIVKESVNQILNGGVRTSNRRRYVNESMFGTHIDVDNELDIIFGNEVSELYTVLDNACSHYNLHHYKTDLTQDLREYQRFFIKFGKQNPEYQDKINTILDTIESIQGLAVYDSVNPEHKYDLLDTLKENLRPYCAGM